MQVPALIVETWASLLDLVYPPKCLVCEELGPKIVCGLCAAGFHSVELPICPRCGASTGQIECRHCANGLPVHLKRVRAAGQFEGSLREAILGLKYKGRLKLVEPLGNF